MAVKQALEAANLTLQEIDILSNEEAISFLSGEGLLSAPQVFHNEKHIGGLQETLAYLKETSIES